MVRRARRTSLNHASKANHAMTMPTEAQIRDAAKQLGHADENGNYPQRLRSKLAQAVQLAEVAETGIDETPPPGTTAEQLGRFAAELTAAGLDGELWAPARADIVLAAAHHLLKTAGLHLIPREETTP
ncbi:hypothetical protein [Nocardia brasiliensis]|uniref:hypothetical protein n=1 Tax=Nocardia brasiliensis TaxID=37326 RepID=UPI002458F3C4|nr:hypothetical protein [Nocardia brasiliensis]